MDWLGRVLQDSLNPIANSIFGYALIIDKNGNILEKVDNTGHLQDESLLKELSAMVSRCRRPIVKQLDYCMGLTNCIIPFGEYFLVTGKDNSRFNDRSKMTSNNTGPNNTKYSISDIVGESIGIVKCKEDALAAAENDCNTLIWGETGTGKELFAQAIHNASERKKGPFIAVNCSSFSSTIVESQLFGYDGGAFTGAKKEGNKGIFEQAHGGTLFLDEISEMNTDIQAKFLRAIQEREVVRVGGGRVIPVDVRIIASSNRDLIGIVREGSFRQDLFYRLYVFDIHLPPLRERKEDIPLIVDSFLTKEYPEENVQFQQCALKKLMEYYWPGNVRELYNCLERSVRLARRKVVQLRDLPPHIREWEKVDSSNDSKTEAIIGRGLEDTLQLAEKRVIEKVLLEANNNRSKAARKLGISSSTLWRKMKVYNII